MTGIEDEVLVVETPLADMLEASGVEGTLRPNPRLLDEEILASFIRIGILRSPKWKPSARGPKLPDIHAVAPLLRHIADYDREHVVVVAVDEQMRLLGVSEVHIGVASEALMSPEDMIRVPLLLGAAGFYWAHNHPSGNPMPSRPDMMSTKKISEVAACSGLAVYGSLTIAYDGYGDVTWLDVHDWKSP